MAWTKKDHLLLAEEGAYVVFANLEVVNRDIKRRNCAGAISRLGDVQQFVGTTELHANSSGDAFAKDEAGRARRAAAAAQARIIKLCKAR